ncbi:MAG TPA: transposase [Candidatus Angelobacter sp.]|nr:transposase [Candidatus Angelobacter sp.]
MPTDGPDNHRRSIRLREYDYAQPGGYFVTICTHDHKCLFGEVVDSEMHLNELGEIVATEWLQTAEIRSEIALDAFVVMPNHVHAVVFITKDLPSPSKDVLPRARRGTGPRSLSALVAGFKAATTRRANSIQRKPIDPLWQRNYYEHVIRNDQDLDRIRRYVTDNPARWTDDGYHPSKIRALIE